MGVINKVVAKGVTYDIEDKINKEELLKRLQGTSENSNAMKDPFKFVGSFNTSTIGDLRTWLDNLHGTSSGLDNRGFYRAILNDSVIEITSSPINYTTEEYIQVVRGRVSVASTTGLLTFSYEYNILERKYSATDGWSSWRVVASADKFEDLYAKAIQIGSFEVESLTDGVGVNFSNIDGTQSDSFEIPSATTESAGVMSAEDKKIVNGIDAAIEEGEKRALRKLFIAAGALYNDTGADITRIAPWGESVTHKDGHYYLNGLGDITDAEMLIIFNLKESIYRLDVPRVLQSAKARTLIPVLNVGFLGDIIKINGSYTFYGNSMEVLYWGKYLDIDATTGMPVVGASIYHTFSSSSNLRVIFPINLNATTSNTNAFAKLPALQIVRLFKLKVSVSFADSSQIDKSSVLYMIQNAAPTKAITITLHADAYARLASDADIVAALETQPLVTLVSA